MNPSHGTLHHVELNVASLTQSRCFWKPFLEMLGYRVHQQWSRGESYILDQTYLVLVQTDEPFVAHGYHRRRIGLNHLALHAGSRKQVDEVRDWVQANNFRELYEERYPFAGGPEHYALFCEDPDRIKVEVVAARDRLPSEGARDELAAATCAPGLDQTLVDAAIELALQRFAGQEAIVAALRTESGRILAGVCAPAAVDSASLCAETGPICEAHRLGERVTASVCLYRAAGAEHFKVLPACGICQERLAVFGMDVQIAVPSTDARQWWQKATLRELRPFYWNDELA